MQRAGLEKKQAGNASKIRIGIVVSDWNADVTEGLLAGARETLCEWNVAEKNIVIIRVAGSYELPYGAMLLARKKKLHAIIALGCLIKGETKHDEYIATAVANGLMEVSLSYKVPVGFGLVTALTQEQAEARSRGGSNKGAEAAIAVLQSALLK